MKYGHINSRGKAYAQGTGNAFGGTGNTTGASSSYKPNWENNKKDTSSKTSSDKSDKETKKDTKDFFDWIERRINSVSKKLERVAGFAEQAFASVPSITKEVAKGVQGISDYANKLINSIFSQRSDKSGKLMDTYSSAYNKYGKLAKKSKLSNKYKKLVRDGKMDVDTIKDEKLKEKINEYQNWWDKSQEALDNFISQAQDFYNIPLDKAAGKVEMLADAIDLFDKQLDNTFVDYDGKASYAAANAIIDKKINRQERQLDVRNQAVNETRSNMNKAYNSKALQNYLKKNKINLKNGEQIDLKGMKVGSKEYKAAIKYNASVVANTNAIKEQQIAQEELTKATREAAKEKFDNIAKAYEIGIKKLQYNFDALDRQIADIEGRGATMSRKYYESQEEVIKKEQSVAKEELSKLQQELGNITEGSDEYYDALEKIESKKGEIADNQIKLYELTNKVIELLLAVYDKAISRIGRFITEQNFIAGLVRGETADKDVLGLTDSGKAQIGAAYANSIAAEVQKQTNREVLEELENMKKSGTTYSKLLNKTFTDMNKVQEELENRYDKEREYTQAVFDANTKIIDLYKQHLNAEKDFYQERVNLQKDALKAEKELHDYQKQIQDKTKSINNLQMQIAAYSGDSSQEAQAKLLRLQSDLNKSQEDLKETEYEHNLSMQEQMLDGLMEEYTERLENYFKNEYKVLEDARDYISTIESDISKIFKLSKESNNVETEFLSPFDINNPNGIGGKINEIAKAIVKEEKDKQAAADAQGTKQQQQQKTQEKQQVLESEGTGNNTLPTEATVDLSGLSKIDEEKERLRMTALDFILGHSTKAKRDKKDWGKYSDVNKKILDITKNKVLSDAALHELADLLNVKYDNAKSSGNLYKKLKEIGVSGFAHGGLVEAVKKNGDDGIASLKVGEAVLTPIQTDLFAKFVDGLPELNNTMNTINKIPTIPTNTVGQTIDYGGVDFNIVVNNPTDGNAIVNEIQHNQKLQKAIQSVSVDRLNGGGRLSVNRIK